MSDLKYPAGEWTHAEFAEANGKTKPSVYNQLQDAIKTGKVIKTGTRATGSRPSQLYKVNDGTAVVVTPAPTVIPPCIVRETIPPITEVKPVEVTVAVTAVKVEEIVDGDRTIEVFDVKPIEPSTKVEEMPANTHSIDETCPVCKHKLFAWNDATGVMVQCLQPIAVCESTEHPFGHGKNEKNAYETLVEKWTFCLKNRA